MLLALFKTFNPYCLYRTLIYRVEEEHLEFSGGSYEILPEGIDR